MALPIGPILMVISSLLPMIFGKKNRGGANQNVTTEVVETQAPGPKTGMEMAMMRPILQMLFNNMQQFQGAGMPGGVGNILGGSGFEDILKMLSSKWPEMMKGFSGASTPSGQGLLNLGTGGGGGG